MLFEKLFSSPKIGISQLVVGTNIGLCYPSATMPLSSSSSSYLWEALQDIPSSIGVSIVRSCNGYGEIGYGRLGYIVSQVPRIRYPGYPVPWVHKIPTVPYVLPYPGYPITKEQGTPDTVGILGTQGIEYPGYGKHLGYPRYRVLSIR